MTQVHVIVDDALSETVPYPWRSLLAAAASATLAHQLAPTGELTVLITGDEMLAALNQSHRGILGPTDVLAFPAGEMPPIPDLAHYFGDIAISLHRAETQAADRGHTVEEELQLLVVHGTLHLLGHDHAESDQKRRMWSAQGEVLGQLGVSIQVPDQVPSPGLSHPESR